MIKRILPVIAGLCVLAVIAMAVALSVGGKGESFTPPPFDPAARTGTPAVPQDAGYGEIDAKEFRFSAAGELTVKNGAADVWLTNPSGSAVWLKVRILDEMTIFWERAASSVPASMSARCSSQPCPAPRQIYP